jgi:AcrR family transcriptional regulator
MEATIDPTKMEEARLAVSRHAAELFWKHGLDGTSGDAIAEAAGISKRTVWRYFRSKEACVEPLFLATSLRFVSHMRDWPRGLSIEDYLNASMDSLLADEQAMRDGVSAVRIIAMMAKEPALRSSWLMACSQAESQLVPVVAARADRWPEDFEVRLCAAAIMAGIRVVDEEISSAAVNEGRRYEQAEATGRLAAAIRSASTLPICDPVA